MSEANYFALLGLPLAFELDQAELDSHYREAVRQVHPDRFAGADEQAQRAALEQAASLNQAHQVLKSATQRALYLLNLHSPLDEETTVQDPQFLFQQLQWREELETLEQASDLDAVEAFRTQMQRERKALEQAFAECWQQTAQRSLAERLVRRMQFFDKLLLQIRELQERLDD